MKAGNPSGASSPRPSTAVPGHGLPRSNGMTRSDSRHQNQKYSLKCHVCGGHVTVYFDGPTMPEMARILIERA
jgi:hypothetical protein